MTGERAGAEMPTESDVCLADARAPLVVRVLVEVLDAGVRFLVEGIGTSSGIGSAPVIIRSVSSTGSGVFSQAILLLGSTDFVFVTNPSLSSLKLLIVSLAFVGLVVVGFACSLRGATFATRVVVVDVILVRFGRGIVKIDR